MVRNGLFALIILILILCIGFYLKPKKNLVDWSHHYNQTSKSPFGTFIVYNSLSSLFPGSDVQIQDEPIYNVLKNNNNAGNLLILIRSEGLTLQSDLSAVDMEQIIRFVKLGNSVLIASNTLEKVFQKNLGIEINYSLKAFVKKESGIRLIDSGLWGKKLFDLDSLHYIPTRSFHLDKKYHPQILGLNGQNEPNYVKYALGKGFVFFHSDPEFLSNYFVLRDNNAEYINSALGYINTPVNHIYWNTYYLHDHRVLSPLDFIFLQSNLRIAAFCILLLFFLFVTVQIKRRQRIIPIILPVQNKTLEFTQTLGLLYFEKGDNKNLLEKMTSQFREFMKIRYFINPKDFTIENLALLVSKTGLEEEDIKKMIQYLQELGSKSEISHQEVLSFNEQLQKFYK